MKPILSIADLVTNPSFGVNIIISESIDKVENGVIVDYSLDSKKVTISLLREYPNRPDTSVKQHVWFWRTNAAANKAFFAKLEEFAYHVHGDLQSDEFKEDFLPLYTAYLNDKLGYGDDPEIINVTYGHDLVAFINFKSEKTTTTYDEAGEPVTSVKTKTHHGRWTLLDPSVDYNNTVVIPRSLFNTAPKFLRLVAETIGVEVDRIFVKEDPTDPNMPSVRVYFDPKDLTYAGSIPVTIPAGGDAIHVYDNVSGLEIESGEGGTTSAINITPLVGTFESLQFNVGVEGGPQWLEGRFYMRPKGSTGPYTDLTFMNENGGFYSVGLDPADQTTQYQVYFAVTIDGVTVQSTPIVVNRAPHPVISDLEYDRVTNSVTGIVSYASEVIISVNLSGLTTVNVVDGMVSHTFSEQLKAGDVITVVADPTQASITVILPPEG